MIKSTRYSFSVCVTAYLLIFTLTRHLSLVNGGNIDRQSNLARQAAVANGILSFLTRQTTKAPSVDSVASGTASAATAATSSISTMANLASGIQAIPSLQSILDASGITRLTDPVWNQVRKQWSTIINSGIVRRVMNPIKSNLQKRRNYA